jgi:hypothetical protein
VQRATAIAVALCAQELIALRRTLLARSLFATSVKSVGIAFWNAALRDETAPPGPCSTPRRRGTQPTIWKVTCAYSRSSA